MRRAGEPQLPEVPIFEAPDFDPARDLAGQDEATRRFVQEMREQGGAIIDLGPAAGALCDAAVAETAAYFRQGRRVQDAWRGSRAVRKLVLSAVVQDHLEAAYGRRPFAFQTLSFLHGTEQELHSDLIHFASLPERFMCGVWIALEDITAEAGPLVYYPGSHRLPVLTMRGAGVNSDRPGVDDYKRVYAPRLAQGIEASGLPRRELVIRKGQAFAWAANLAHGGAPVLAPGATRRSLVVHYYFEDCLYFTPMVSDVEAGRLAVRLPLDISTGGWRWPRRNGRPVRPPLKMLAAALLQMAQRRPHVS